MATASSTLAGTRPRRLGDRLGDGALRAVTAAAALLALALLAAIAYELVHGAHAAISKFGLGFVTGRAWDPVRGSFGALDFIYGTAVTSLLAIVIATPLSIGIGLFLSELAPRAVREVVGPLVEMLAAVPSVILGLWGILVLGPFLSRTLEPFLHRTLGWLPLFSGQPQQTGSGYLTAAIVLTIMVVPIIASVSRELFLSVPRETKEGALALGMTRWEMVRGVVLPATRSGIAAAVILGLGRALGEAIAVTQVIGNATGIHVSLFQPGDTLASRIAAQYQGFTSVLQGASLIYLALILLVFSIAVNAIAQLIVSRFDLVRTAGA
jgi:phosphate transport system permease protein